MKKLGPNEVQLSDMTNQFFQMNIQNTWKKEYSAIFTEKQTRTQFIFLESFKCNTNSKSVICHKRNFLMLTLANFINDFSRKVFHYAFDI